MPEPAELDAIDQQLISHLEANARISNKELAELVGVAPSTCHARVRALVKHGVITGFHAEVDPSALGRSLEAMISIRLHAYARSTLRGFEDFLLGLPATRQVFFLSGERDFLVHVAVRSSDELRDLVADSLSSRSEVAATNTSIVFSHATR